MGSLFDAQYGYGGDPFAFVDSVTRGVITIQTVVFVTITDIVTGILATTNQLETDITQVFDFSFLGLSSAWRGMQLLLDLIRNISFGAIISHIMSLLKALQAFAKKLKAWLDAFERIQRLQQLQSIKLLLNSIQRIRHFLAILRIFHVKFAQKLDAILSHIQGGILGRFLPLQQKLNRIIDWVDLVADPSGLFRFAPLIMSIGRDFDTLIRLVTGRGVDHWFVDHSGELGAIGVQSNYTTYYARLGADLQTRAPHVVARQNQFLYTYAALKARQ